MNEENLYQLLKQVISNGDFKRNCIAMFNAIQAKKEKNSWYLGSDKLSIDYFIAMFSDHIDIINEKDKKNGYTE